MKRILISSLIPASLLLSSSISAELSDETNTNLISMEEVHSEVDKTELPVLKDESTSDETEAPAEGKETSLDETEAPAATEKEVLTFVEDPSLNILVNQDKVNFEHVPFVVGQHTLVPYKLTFIIMGAEVNWDEISQTITATKGDKSLKLIIGSHIANINNKEVEMPFPATIIDSEVLVPIEWLSEVFNISLVKNEDLNEIYIELENS